MSGARAALAVLLLLSLARMASAAGLSCSQQAITCVRVEGHAPRGQMLPATFGMPFAPGEVPAGATLAAQADGRAVPLQLDEPATYPDGSLRFAILSLSLPQGGGVVSILRGPSAAGAAVDPTAWLRAGHDVRVALNLYSPQISTITLGNRKGTEPGIAFRPGDRITARLGDDPADSFAVQVADNTAGGGFSTLTRLSVELDRAINRSARFRSYKIGEGGGYETLWVTTRGGAAAARPFSVRVETSGEAAARSEIVQRYEPPRRYAASARAMLADAAPHPWLSGPAVGETLLAGPLRDEDGTPHPRLTARIALRGYAGASQARADVSVEDLWAYDPGPRNWRYDVEISHDGRPAFSQSDVTQYHHARWHKVLWSDADPGTVVEYDRRHLLNSRAVPHYDERLAVAPAAIEAEAAALRAADTGLMGGGTVTPYFATTGGRGDIGPLPRWTALYLLSMDPRALAVMLANADASGGIPIHYRDRTTDRPVSIDDHPRIVMGAWPPTVGPDKVPDVTNGETPWSPDAAHQPSLAYVPYLVTGDRYYLEETQFWADWNLGIAAVDLRQGSKGLLIDNGQTRATAWGLRALAEAAAITPDRDPMKRYLEAKLANNIQYASSLAARRSSPLGLDAVRTGNDRFAPWQLDFLIVTVGQIADAGYAGADALLEWLALPALGLWTNEANGFCRFNAPAGWLSFREPGTRRPFGSWGELQRANFPAQAACPQSFPAEAYETSAQGYVAHAMAAAAVLADHRIPAARPLFDWLEAREHGINFARDPTWRIVPR